VDNQAGAAAAMAITCLRFIRTFSSQTVRNSPPARSWLN